MSAKLIPVSEIAMGGQWQYIIDAFRDLGGDSDVADIMMTFTPIGIYDYTFYYCTPWNKPVTVIGKDQAALISALHKVKPGEVVHSIKAVGADSAYFLIVEKGAN